jgi:hypothetical protein
VSGIQQPASYGWADPARNYAFGGRHRQKTPAASPLRTVRLAGSKNVARLPPSLSRLPAGSSANDDHCPFLTPQE